MATLYPPSISDQTGIPESEKQVFEKLALLDDTYHVFHSLTWHDGREVGCDFLSIYS